MAGYAVQKPRKVQQKITAQLSGWLLVGRDGLYGFLQNRAPLFVFAWQTSRRWAACTRISGSFMGKRCAGSFPVGENWYRSCWYFTRFMPMCAHRSLALARAAMSIFNVWRTMGPSASSASSSHEKLGKTHAICWGVLTFNCSAELWWISKYNYWQGKQGVLMVYVCFIVGFVFFFNSRPWKVIVPWGENELLSVMEGYMVWLAGMHVLRIPRKVLLDAASWGKCQLLLSVLPGQ